MESNYSSDNIPEIALSWVSLGEPVVLATVVETWGSALPSGGADGYQLKWKDAGFIGRMYRKRSCVRSRRDIQHKKIRLLEYGVSNEDVFRLACGGKIRVMLEPVGHSISIETLKRLVELGEIKFQWHVL